MPKNEMEQKAMTEDVVCNCGRNQWRVVFAHVGWITYACTRCGAERTERGETNADA